jgi:hypothetical protein
LSFSLLHLRYSLTFINIIQDKRWFTFTLYYWTSLIANILYYLMYKSVRKKK